MTTTGASMGGEGNLSRLFDVPGVHSGDRRFVPVHAPQVERAALWVRASGVLEKLAQWRTEDGYDPTKGGRPSQFTDEHALVLLAVLALEGQELTAVRARDLVLTRLTDAGLEALNVNLNDHRWVKGERGVYLRLWRTVRRVLDVIDPHPDEQHHSRYTYREYATLLSKRDTDLEERRRQRLAEFTNALIWTTVEALPERLLKNWDGTIAVDGTHVPLVKKGITGFGPDNRQATIEAARVEHARKNRKKVPTGSDWKPLAERWQEGPRSERKVSSEPYGGWYTRTHEEIDKPDGHRDTKWALDAQLAFMAHPGPDPQFPHLVLGMGLDKPARQPRQSAMTALANVMSHDLPRGYVVGDRDYYPHAQAEDWAIPLRSAGYKIVGDLRRDTHGVMGHFAGAELVDGNWYCPAMPILHKNATVDYHAAQGKVAKAITNRQRLTRAIKDLQPASGASEEKQAAYRGAQVNLRRAEREEAKAKEEFARVEARWKELLEYRQRFLLRPREAPRENGSQAFKCPASGSGATVSCPLKKEPPRTSKGTRTPIQKGNLPKHPGKVCTNSSGITIPVEESAKYAQALVWQSDEWKRAYAYPRSMNEARNGWLKNVQGGSIADHARRPMRGLAAQSLLLALMLGAENIRAIEVYLRDEDKPKKPRPPKVVTPVATWDSEEDDYDWADAPNAPPVAA
ncbi:hypothetical protein [Luteococcus sanguinis]|uniref:Transposase n=1 Tax=Luteococcus sanguinis TaxID=174038 RepID=A0ABW1X827_9ACTN